MTGTELDAILADESSDETAESAASETTADDAGPARDDLGRFAPKAGEPDPSNRGPRGPEREGADPVGAEAGQVPQQALHAAREKEREAKQEAEELRRELAEMRGQVNLLTRQRQPEPKPAEQPKKPEYWEDPDGFVNAALTPVQQQLRQHTELVSRRFAIKEHGAETVQAAYQALGTAMDTDPNVRADYQRIMSSDDPFEDLVQWHKRRQTMQTVGNDPQAWFEAEFEKRLNDPAHQAKIIERLRSSAAQTTDRSSPPVSLPPSLSRLPSGGNAADDGDMSDAALFSHAMR